MADIFSKKKRSAIMAAIKAKGTRSTELAVRRILRGSGITGWRANLKAVPGTPDFVFLKIKLAVFVDGCFWHGCPTCIRNRRPSTNAGFWRKKIAGNKRRDKRVDRKLRRMGWSVIRIWEHSVEKDGAKVGKRLLKAVSFSRNKAERQKM